MSREGIEPSTRRFGICKLQIPLAPGDFESLTPASAPNPPCPRCRCPSDVNESIRFCERQWIQQTAFRIEKTTALPPSCSRREDDRQREDRRPRECAARLPEAGRSVSMRCMRARTDAASRCYTHPNAAHARSTSTAATRVARQAGTHAATPVTARRNSPASDNEVASPVRTP